MVATTLRDRSPAIQDNVTNNNALLSYLRKRGNIKMSDGGRTIFFPITYQDGGTFQYYSGYDTLNLSTKPVIDAAEYNWKFAAVTVSISGQEMVQNSGKSAVIDLLDGKIEAAENDLENGISQGVYSDGTGSGGKQIGGLALLVADTPTSGTVGGINRATWPIWQNIAYNPIAQGGAAVDATNIVNYMNGIYNQLVRGQDKTDVIIADNAYFGFYQASQQQLQRFTSADSASAGFVELTYMGGVKVIMDGGSYSTAITPTGINGVGNYTGEAANHMHFLNTRYIKFVVHSDRNFDVIGETRESINQDAEVRLSGFAGNMCLLGARFQGVLTNN